ncbi:MAG: TonB-dependent receptor plug domain-containing protein [Sphingomonadaceae bacterium]|nr:TonB-dependent receptor plug domain-containing protein [Sphingomonadaceae bacterium]
MKFARSFLLCGVASLGVAAAPAFAQVQNPTTDAAAAPPNNAPANAPGDIIVTARRVNERLQDVPVAVSVISPATLNSKGVFTPVDLQRDTPDLSVSATTSDRNNVTYTIRGQGFSYGTLFPAVVTYYNEVPTSRLTAGQFFDLSNVQILRGPQGVNFGRVTDGGNVMVTPQKPTNSFGGYASVKLGDYNLRQFDAALNVPLVEDKILLRGAVEIARRDGFTRNIGNGEDQDNVAYESYRLGIVLRPVEGLENYTSFQYQRTHDNGTSVVPEGINESALRRNYGALSFLFNGIPGVFPGYDLDARGNVVPRGQGVQPLTVDALVASYKAQLAAQQARGHRVVDYDDASYDRRRNIYLVNTTTADLTDTIQLKNIFGYINERDDEASNFTGTNGNAITTCHSNCENVGGSPNGGLPFSWQEQFSEELRLSGKAFNNNLTWNVGGYVDKQRPGGLNENDTINVAILERDDIQNQVTTSKALYASGEYDLHDLLPGLKINGGIRRTHDTVDSNTETFLRPIYFPTAVAPAFPHGECANYTGVLGPASCTNFKAKFNVTTWAAGISYKVDGGPLVYAKASRGYRPGGTNASAIIG